MVRVKTGEHWNITVGTVVTVIKEVDSELLKANNYNDKLPDGFVLGKLVIY